MGTVRSRGWRAALAVIAGCSAPGGPLLAVAVQAQHPTPRGLHERFLHQALTRNDGLPDVMACSIAQDRDGFLWIGTVDGLVRHDGIALRHHRLRDDPALVEDAFVHLVFDRDGRLWAAGLSSLRFRDESGWHAIDLPGEFTTEPIRDLVATPDGRVHFSCGRHIASADATCRIERTAPPADGRDEAVSGASSASAVEAPAAAPLTK